MYQDPNLKEIHTLKAGDSFQFEGKFKRFVRQEQGTRYKVEEVIYYTDPEDDSRHCCKLSQLVEKVSGIQASLF